MPQTEAQQRQLDSYLDGAGAEFRPAFTNVGGHWGMAGGPRAPYDRGTSMRGGVGEQIFGGLFRGLFDMFDGGGIGRSGETFQGGPLSGVLNSLGVSPLNSLQAPRTSPTPSARPAMAPAPAPAPMPEQSAAGVPPSPVSGAGLLGSVGVGAPNITGALGFDLQPMADPSIAQFGPVSPVAMPGLLGSGYNDAPPMTEIGRTPVLPPATPEQMAGQPPTGPAVMPDMPQDPMTEAPALVDAEIPGLALAFRSLDTRQPASETVRNVQALGPLTTPQMDTRGTLEGLLGNPVAPGVLPPDDTITQPALSFRESPVQRPFGGSTALAFGEQPEVRMSTRGNSPLQIFEGTRAQYDPATGLNISMDFNASANGGARGTEVIIPDDASPELRAAAERFNQGVRAFAAQNGIEDYPIRGVRTRSENGRGVPNTVHVEPFFNDDLEMQELVAANPGAFAEIYREAFGGIDGRLIAPHGVGRDRGAGSPVFTDETSFGEMMARSLLSEPEQPMTANNMPMGGLLGELSRPIQDVRLSTRGMDPTADIGSPEAVGISYDLAGKQRPNPPNNALQNTIARAVEQTFGPGSRVEIYSGQEDPGKQHGSNRHKTGLAADVRIYDPQGNRVTSADPRARDFMQAAAGLGILGIGAGPEYMDGNFHLDMFPPSMRSAGQGPVWGSSAAALQNEIVPLMDAAGTSPVVSERPQARPQGLLASLGGQEAVPAQRGAVASFSELNIPTQMGAARDAAVLEAVRAGNVSPMSLETTPVTVDGRYAELPDGVDKVVFDVGNAPVMLGQEGVLYPASFDGGPQVAAALGGAAPTRVIVDAGMDQGRTVPMPTQTPGPGMTDLEAAQRQSEAIRDKLNGLTFFGKEILADGSFYGGVKSGGGLWQSRPSRGRHSGDYADYSHGVRVVKTATVYPTNGEPYQVPVADLYKDPAFARALGL